MNRVRCLLFVAVTWVGITGCSASPADVNTAQQLADIADAMNALRQDNAILQDQVDSLRIVVARQDTIITRLATFAGVPLPPR